MGALRLCVPSYSGKHFVVRPAFFAENVDIPLVGW